jgi:uncharacterized membrane protein (UPF0127 family)
MMFKNVLFLWLLILVSCNKDAAKTSSSSSHPNNSELKKELPQFKLPISILKTAAGNNFKAYLAVSSSEQVLGLSEMPEDQWGNDDGMLFWYDEDDARAFWMPDTYFNLDIIFLDKDLKVVGIDRNVPHYIGRNHPERIPRTNTYTCRYVLELKSSSAMAKEIQIGDTLTWVSPPPWKIK